MGSDSRLEAKYIYKMIQEHLIVPEKQEVIKKTNKQTNNYWGHIKSTQERDFPDGSVIKNLPSNARDSG